MRWSYLLCIVTIACATTTIAPSEKLAFDYTRAFLRRDSTEMQTLGTAGVEHPTPSAYFSARRVFRTCPVQPTKGGPEAQAILVLLSAGTEDEQFEAIQVTVAHYGEQWLVIDAHAVPLRYNRACKPIYGTGY
jgi:hypothetical protein